MNKAYRLIWSLVKDAWVIVAEIVKGNGGPPPLTVPGVVLAASLSLFSGGVYALPVAPTVASGTAAFSTSANTLTITNSPNAIINWQGFSIAANEITRFNQQSISSAVLNRVTGIDPSQILGSLQSNGKVFLINPNGIIFGQGSRIDVGGLVASSLGISNQDFLNGNYNFAAGATAGAVINQGAITTTAGGMVWLISPNVENSGIITSPTGSVMLAAGQSVNMIDPQRPEIAVVVTAPADQAVNIGTILTQGGSTGIFGSLVNQQGIINANSAVVGENGRIFLKSTTGTTLGKDSVTSANGIDKADGGKVVVLSDGHTEVAGSISATGGVNGGDGGFVETSGNSIDFSTANVNASAPKGKAGLWLIDPTNLNIGLAEATTIASTLNGGTNSSQTATGNINVNSGITWTSSNALSLTADYSLNVNAPISGLNGSLFLTGKGLSGSTAGAPGIAIYAPVSTRSTTLLGTGSSGNNVTSGGIGVLVSESVTTSNGDLTVTGIGGAGVGSAGGTGVEVRSGIGGPYGSLTAGTGNIIITGTGGKGGYVCPDGCFGKNGGTGVLLTGSVTTSGTVGNVADATVGSIVITGTGGDGGTPNDIDEAGSSGSGGTGVSISDWVKTDITVNGTVTNGTVGAIDITGTGGNAPEAAVQYSSSSSAGNGGTGISVYGGVINTYVTVNPVYNVISGMVSEVDVTVYNSSIGSINLTGTGGTGGTSRSSSSTVKAVGGDGGTGIDFQGNAYSNARVDGRYNSSIGTITMQGNGGKGGEAFGSSGIINGGIGGDAKGGRGGDGVLTDSGAYIASYGYAATITLRGTGGSGGSATGGDGGPKATTGFYNGGNAYAGYGGYGVNHQGVVGSNSNSLAANVVLEGTGGNGGNATGGTGAFGGNGFGGEGGHGIYQYSGSIYTGFGSVTLSGTGGNGGWGKGGYGKEDNATVYPPALGKNYGSGNGGRGGKGLYIYDGSSIESSIGSITLNGTGGNGGYGLGGSAGANGQGGLGTGGYGRRGIELDGSYIYSQSGSITLSGTGGRGGDGTGGNGRSAGSGEGGGGGIGVNLDEYSYIKTDSGSVALYGWGGSGGNGFGGNSIRVLEGDDGLGGANGFGGDGGTGVKFWRSAISSNSGNITIRGYAGNGGNGTGGNGSAGSNGGAEKTGYDGGAGGTGFGGDGGYGINFDGSYNPDTDVYISLKSDSGSISLTGFGGHGGIGRGGLGGNGGIGGVGASGAPGAPGESLAASGFTGGVGGSGGDALGGEGGKGIYLNIEAASQGTNGGNMNLYGKGGNGGKAYGGSGGAGGIGALGGDGGAYNGDNAGVGGNAFGTGGKGGVGGYALSGYGGTGIENVSGDIYTNSGFITLTGIGGIGGAAVGGVGGVGGIGGQGGQGGVVVSDSTADGGDGGNGYGTGGAGGQGGNARGNHGGYGIMFDNSGHVTAGGYISFNGTGGLGGVGTGGAGGVGGIGGLGGNGGSSVYSNGGTGGNGGYKFMSGGAGGAGGVGTGGAGGIGISLNDSIVSDFGSIYIRGSGGFGGDGTGGAGGVGGIDGLGGNGGNSTYGNGGNGGNGGFEYMAGGTGGAGGLGTGGAGGTGVFVNDYIGSNFGSISITGSGGYGGSGTGGIGGIGGTASQGGNGGSSKYGFGGNGGYGVDARNNSPYAVYGGDGGVGGIGRGGSGGGGIELGVNGYLHSASGSINLYGIGGEGGIGRGGDGGKSGTGAVGGDGGNSNYYLGGAGGYSYGNFKGESPWSSSGTRGGQGGNGFGGLGGIGIDSSGKLSANGQISLIGRGGSGSDGYGGSGGDGGFGAIGGNGGIGGSGDGPAGIANDSDSSQYFGGNGGSGGNGAGGNAGIAINLSGGSITSSGSKYVDISGHSGSGGSGFYGGHGDGGFASFDNSNGTDGISGYDGSDSNGAGNLGIKQTTTLISSQYGGVSLTADSMTLAGTIDAQYTAIGRENQGDITLVPGSTKPGTGGLELTGTELATITTDALTIGNENTNNFNQGGVPLSAAYGISLVADTMTLSGGIYATSVNIGRATPGAINLGVADVPTVRATYDAYGNIATPAIPGVLGIDSAELATIKTFDYLDVTVPANPVNVYKQIVNLIIGNGNTSSFHQGGVALAANNNITLIADKMDLSADVDAYSVNIERATYGNMAFVTTKNADNNVLELTSGELGELAYIKDTSNTDYGYKVTRFGIGNWNTSSFDQGGVALSVSSSNDGSIRITADNMNLSGNITAPTVNLTKASYGGNGKYSKIDLGGDDAPDTGSGSTLGLTNSELNKINASTLYVGGWYNDSLDVSKAIDLSGKAFNLSLETSGTISINNLLNVGENNLTFNGHSFLNSTSQGAGATITANSLLLMGRGTHNLGATNQINYMATDYIGGLTFKNGKQLTINGGGINSTGDVNLKADSMDISQSIIGQTVTLAPVTTNRNISLGSETAGALSIDGTELGRISAGDKLVVENGVGGALNVKTSLDLSSYGFSSLILSSNSINMNGNSITTGGLVGVRPYTTSTPITLDATNISFGSSTIPWNSLDAGTLSVGSPELSGRIDVSGPVNIVDKHLILATGGNLNISNTLSISYDPYVGSGDLILYAGGTATQTASANITADRVGLAGGAFTLLATGNKIGVVAGDVASVALNNSQYLWVGTQSDTLPMLSGPGLTASGNISLTSAPSTADSGGGIYVVSPISSTGGGNITLTGTGGAMQTGISLYGNVSTTGSGTITLTGIGGSGGQSLDGGTGVESGAVITTASGSVTITGTGGNRSAYGGDSSYGGGIGVNLAGDVISTYGGAVTVTGRGGSETVEGNGGGAGVVVNEGALVSGGTVSISGTGGNGTVSGGAGIHTYSGSYIQTETNIYMEGKGGNSGSGSGAAGIEFNGVISSNNGPVTLKGTGGDAGGGSLSTNFYGNTGGNGISAYGYLYSGGDVVMTGQGGKGSNVTMTSSSGNSFGGEGGAGIFVTGRIISYGSSANSVKLTGIGGNGGSATGYTPEGSGNGKNAFGGTGGDGILVYRGMIDGINSLLEFAGTGGDGGFGKGGNGISSGSGTGGDGGSGIYQNRGFMFSNYGTVKLKGIGGDGGYGVAGTASGGTVGRGTGGSGGYGLYIEGSFADRTKRRIRGAVSSLFGSVSMEGIGGNGAVVKGTETAGAGGAGIYLNAPVSTGGYVTAGNIASSNVGNITITGTGGDGGATAAGTILGSGGIGVDLAYGGISTSYLINGNITGTSKAGEITVVGTGGKGANGGTGIAGAPQIYSELIKLDNFNGSTETTIITNGTIASTAEVGDILMTGTAGAGGSGGRGIDLLAGDISATEGAVTLENNTGTLTLRGTISGSDIVLYTKGAFVNSYGVGALTAGTGGRWLVWSADPRLDTRGGLLYDFKQYGATYGVTPVAQSTGNGFLYSLTPTASVTLTGNVTKVYDGTLAATLTSGNYIVAGIDGDTVRLNLPTTGTYDTKNFGSGKTVTVSGITVAGAVTNGAAAVYGYNPVNSSASGAVGTINKASLTLTPKTDTKTYDGTTNSTAVVTVSGKAAGDTLTVAEQFESRNVLGIDGSTLLIKPGYTVRDAAGADMSGNYTISASATAFGTINKADLMLTTSNVTKTYDGSLSASGTARVSSGTLFAGDTISGGTFAYTNKNAGTGNKTVTVGGVTVDDGNGGGNYNVGYVNNNTSTINKANLTLTPSTATKEYDGNTSSSAVVGVAGNIEGDTVTAAEQFGSKNVLGANGSTLSVKPGFTVLDALGADMSGNYSIVTSTTPGTITVRPLSIWTGLGGDFLWSNPANWDAIPDNQNVLAVLIPSGGSYQVKYDLTGTVLQNIDSWQSLHVAAGSLAVGSAFNTAGLYQTGGAITGSAALNVTDSFTQTGGSINLTGPATLIQSTGNMNIAGLKASTVSLTSRTGGISETGSIVTSSLATDSATGTVLNGSNNISIFRAVNSTSGNIVLSNTASPLTIESITNYGGSISVVNRGGMVIAGSVESTVGAVYMEAHSPLTTNVGANVTGYGDVTLFAGVNRSPDDNLTVNGNVTSRTGNVLLQAGELVIVKGIALPSSENVTGNSSLTAANQTGRVIVRDRLNSQRVPSESLYYLFSTMGREALDLTEWDDRENATDEGGENGTQFSALPYCN